MSMLLRRSFIVLSNKRMHYKSLLVNVYYLWKNIILLKICEILIKSIQYNNNNKYNNLPRKLIIYIINVLYIYRYTHTKTMKPYDNAIQ